MISRSTLWRAVPLLVLLVLISIAISLITPRQTPSSNPPDITNLVNTRRSNGQTLQALYQIETQAAQSGWTAGLSHTAGDLARDVGDLALAVAYWEAALIETPEDVNLLRKIAQAYIDLQRWTQVIDTLERLLRADPQNHWAHYQLGLLRAALDPFTAAAHLQAALAEPTFVETAQAILLVLESNSNDPLISMRVGIVLVEHELWAFAEVAFTHAAALAQPFPEALAYEGLARDHQGKDGSLWFEQAVSFAPENALVRYLQGLHLRHAGDFVGSLEVLNLAVLLDPTNPAYCAELAQAYRLTGDIVQAAYWYQQAFTLSGEAAEFRYLLAMFYAEEASTLNTYGIDTAAAIDALIPNDSDVRASFGWSLHTAGHTEAGLGQIASALTLDPQNIRALYYRARILLDIGDRANAIPLLQQVEAAGGEFSAEARRILDELGY